MTTTVHTFTNLGFRTMPIGKAGYRLVRDEGGKKHILDAKDNIVSFNAAMPSDWTKVYGKHRKQHNDTPLGGLICGRLDNLQEDEIEVVALDCDNEAAWLMATAMNPAYKFSFRSIDKPGGTVLYILSDSLVKVPQFSIDNNGLKLEYMARRESGANAMVYLPTSANETKEQIAKGAELEEMPEHLVSLIKSLQPVKAVQAPVEFTSNLSMSLPFNAPLIKQYVLEAKAAKEENATFGKLKHSPIVEKVYAIFTPKEFRSSAEYQKQGWLHPNSDSLTATGPYSKYITGVSAIAGADQSISPELYIEFMQAINAQLDAPYLQDRYLTEILNPMILGQAKINGKPIWKYNDSWDKDSHSITNQYGEILEYFADEHEANNFVEYNHSTARIVRVQGVSPLLDRIYTMDTDAQQERPNKNLVKKLKLVEATATVKLPPGIFVDTKGKTLLNSALACESLQILREPSLFPTEVTEHNLYVQAFNMFVKHLTNDCEMSQTFMRQLLAYHGRYLTNIPVIVYMVGVGGSGKSQFSNILEELFGSNVTRRPTPKQMASQFNDYLDNCALLVLSETSDAIKQEQRGLKSVLKVVTGEKTIDIETKGKPLKPNVPLFALPLMLANDFWYDEDENDRRLFVVNPIQTLYDAPEIVEFEQEHGVRLVDFIIEGTRRGYIAKYLTQFCPAQLPEVPLTKDKLESSGAQDDIISVIKNLVSRRQYIALFELFTEYEISTFFTVMNAPNTSGNGRIHDFIYVQQIIDLAIAMRGDDKYPSDATIKKEFWPKRWSAMQKYHIRHATNSGPTYYKRVGTAKWEMPELKAEFDTWTLAQLENTDGEL